MDLESLNLDIIGKLNISFESEDALFDPNEYAVGNVKDEEEFDLLSEVVNEINDHFGKGLEVGKSTH